MNGSCEVTILMPCLNEARTLMQCINKARGYLSRSNIVGEIVVADNGSSDGSQRIAQAAGARVVNVEQRGYGSALLAGISAARGKYVIMGDSDNSYDFGSLDPFMEKLRGGYLLVVGNRFRGGILPGAMPPLHRYLGNPVLSSIGRIFFGRACGDFHCGLRGFDREAMLALDLQSRGMEFASEMIVKAMIARLRVTEVPTTLAPDGRDRRSHLKTWRDGWRHLRFLLLYSPRGLFLYPGLTILTLGLICFAALIGGDIHVGGVTFAEHTLIIGCTAIIIGAQAMAFWVFAEMVAMHQGLLPPHPRLEGIRKLANVEAGSLIGGALITFGMVGDVVAVIYWGTLSFGPVERAFLIRLVATACTLMILGFQVLYSSFLIYLVEYVEQKARRASRSTFGESPNSVKASL